MTNRATGVWGNKPHLIQPYILIDMDKLQIRWNKTDDPEWPLEVVYKLFKQGETKELDRLLAKESYPKLAPCRTITGKKYAQIPGVWKERIKADAETMALPVYVVDIDGDPIKWNG